MSSSIYRDPVESAEPHLILSMAETMDFLGLGRTLLTQMIKRGQIPAFKAFEGSRPWMFHRGELEQWALQKGRQHQQKALEGSQN